MKFETDSWYFIPAKWFTKFNEGRREVRVIVIHVMEAPEKVATARNIGNYFANLPETTKASSHIGVDSNEIIQYVRDNDIAYAAPGCNHDGIQIELAGYSRQTIKEWLDPYSVKLISNAAYATAQYCRKYDIPVRHLSVSELREGKRGIVGHDQVSIVYHKSTHIDPGQGFPWITFLDLVRVYTLMLIKRTEPS